MRLVKLYNVALVRANDNIMMLWCNDTVRGIMIMNTKLSTLVAKYKNIPQVVKCCKTDFELAEEQDFETSLQCVPSKVGQVNIFNLVLPRLDKCGTFLVTPKPSVY